MKEFFIKCRSVPILQVWRGFDTTNDSGKLSDTLATGSTQPVPPQARPTPSLVKWLPSFYDEFIMAISYESQWISNIFDDPVSVLADLAIEVAVQIKETFQTRLSSQSVDSLISLYNATKGTVSYAHTQYANVICWES